jgi:hypothetical protein
MRKAIGSLLALGCWGGCGVDQPELDPGAGGSPLYTPAPAITSVATIAGFTQIRHGYESWLEGFADRLVLTGSGLAGVTEILVGPLPAIIVSATATQVLVDVDIPHGFPARPLEVTASGPGWLATSPDPITVTRVVVAPGAPLGGRGTHQSPAALCEPGQPWWESTPALAVEGSQIHAVVGASLPRGDLGLAGSSVTGTGLFGIYLADGSLSLSAGTQVSSPHTAVHVSGLGDQYVSMSATGASLVGGQVGLDFSSSESTSLELRGTLAQGGNFGLRIHTYNASLVDLGTAASPGENQLIGSVFAYSVGSDYFGTYQAVGTTLNGSSYAGQTISGPTSQPPDYDISSFEIATQF